ncbi:S8 family serine peptidase [Candidatus Acetothermia bacterium]|nr:S8 family serine peptidase [Candidatus Acetothermia bacterium]MBI3642836.1 S8 family serine peptidase [Candidatus Acetothermia bacterium]
MLTIRWNRVGIFATALLMIFGVVGWSEGLNLISETSLNDNHSKLQVALEQLIAISKSNPDSSTRVAPSFELIRSKDSPAQSGSYPSLNLNGNRIQVIIETLPTANLALLRQQIEHLGGQVQLTKENLTQALLPIEALEPVANNSDVSFVRLPIRSISKQNSQPTASSASQGDVISEGVPIIGAPAWHDAGFNGEGTKVGIIDEFGLYQNLEGKEVPPSDRVVMRSFASQGEMFDPRYPEKDQAHGTAVAEIINDIAPAATHYLAYNETDVEFRQAIDWLIGEKVDVINTSLGLDSACYRGGGVFEPYFAKAHRNGISWATAAGNEADIHWEGTFNDSDGDNLNNYSSDDNGNTVESLLTKYQYPSGKQVATAEIYGIFSWDAPCTGASDDYEVVVMKNVNGQLKELSTNSGDWYWEPGRPIKIFYAYEDFDVSRVGEKEKYEIVIRKKNPDAQPARMMIQNYGCYCTSIQYLTAQGSVGILEPSVSPNTLAIGAIHASPSGCPQTPAGGYYCPDGRLFWYSSQGPTTDGRIKPEFAAPAHVSTKVFGHYTGDGFDDDPGFTGTSASTPHATGAVALVVQALRAQGKSTAPEEVLSFLKDQAEDLGPAGQDDKYGSGLLYLGVPPKLEVAPTITAIEPPSGLQGSTLTATITGTSLSDATKVVFSGDGVTATIDTGAAETSLPITITIAASAAPGARTIEVTNAAGTAQSRNIVFTVEQGPTLQVSSSSLSFSGTAHGDNPASQSLQIGNSGGGSLTWSAEVSVPWLTLSQASGTTAEQVTVSVNTAGLEAGTYQGEITIKSSEALNASVVIPVTLTLASTAQNGDGDLIVLAFKFIEFVIPENWDRTLTDGCVVYKNISTGSSLIRVTLDDNTTREFEIPAAQEVIVCGDVVHIDTRPPQS